jgi:hypothetical protein
VVLNVSDWQRSLPAAGGFMRSAASAGRRP